MPEFAADIFTEPQDIDGNTLANLGPLRPLAGVWQSSRGRDVNPKAQGPEHKAFVERIELQPIDPQTNGPQLLYGLRYHTHIVEPHQIAMFHDQVGYWLWEPATGTIIHTLTIPRGQVALAVGHAAPHARSFEVRSQRGSTANGICSGRFLEYAFRTLAFRIRVSIHRNGTWSYRETTTLKVRGQSRPFQHVDRNTLRRIAPPTPNALARRRRR